MFDNIIDPNSKTYSFANKVFEFVCCQKGCQEFCDCCLPPKKPKLKKTDIKHLVHQPASYVGDCFPSPTFSGAETCSSFSGRERLDSDRSSTASTTSRKESFSSNTDFRKSTATPIIDMKPIEFWAATNRETVQPRTPKRIRLQSENELSLDNFNVDLYEVQEKSDECLTDEEKLSRYKLGQVHFSLQYEIPTKCLIVRIIEARDLPRPLAQDAHKQDMAHSNPYAKICLLPDQKNSKQTTVQRKTQCPNWSEIFRFEMPFKEVQKRTLEVTVKDFDKYSRHCIIGHTHLRLDNINLIKGGHMWKPLMPSTKEQPELGELMLSLNYLPTAGRINIDIIKAKQLIQTDLVGGSDPFVKVALCIDQKQIKTKKTSVKKNTIDPVFNESMTFHLNGEQPSQCSLVVTVWDYNSKSRDDFVGRIVLGKYATGTLESTHWNHMQQSQRTPVAQWHTLRPRKECDELSIVSPMVS